MLSSSSCLVKQVFSTAAAACLRCCCFGGGNEQSLQRSVQQYDKQRRSSGHNGLDIKGHHSVFRDCRGEAQRQTFSTLTYLKQLAADGNRYSNAYTSSVVRIFFPFCSRRVPLSRSVHVSSLRLGKQLS